MGGDNFQYFVNNSTGEWASVWTIEWDEQSERDEFYSAYLEWSGSAENPYSGEFTQGRASIVRNGTVSTIYRASSPSLLP